MENKLNKIFIDVSKISEDKLNHLMSLMPSETDSDSERFKVTQERRFLTQFSAGLWWICSELYVSSKIEVTYFDFCDIVGEKPVFTDNDSTLESDLLTLVRTLNFSERFKAAFPRTSFEIEKILKKYGKE
jgi:hypothetical protein